MTKERSVRESTQRMVRRIVKDFAPDRVILFGSHARGQAGPDSDVDLLVGMPVEDSKRAKQLESRAALHDVHVPKDIIVSTPEEFRWRKDTVGISECPAAREGEVLYAREVARRTRREVRKLLKEKPPFSKESP